MLAAPASTVGRSRQSERGFTLAALIVIMTILAVMIAYTVPRMWSKVVQRDRDKQTVFVMRQYARAILEFQRQHAGTYPVSLDQLKEARKPRLVRGPKSEWVDPLTGKVDWILLPPTLLPNAAAAGGPGSGYNPSPLNPAYNGPNQQQPPAAGGGGAGGPAAPAPPAGNPADPASATGQGVSTADYKGPFVGVRPNKSGPSYLRVKNEEKYEKWLLTSEDVKQEITARINAGQIPGAPGAAPISGGMPGQKPGTTRP